MSEEFVMCYLPDRIKRLGYRDYLKRFREIVLEPFSDYYFPAYNELWFIIGAPTGVRVESLYGIYHQEEEYFNENSYEHRGEISIRNTGNGQKKLKVIQVIIIN
jgi:hypothetical protein